MRYGTLGASALLTIVACGPGEIGEGPVPGAEDAPPALDDEEQREHPAAEDPLDVRVPIPGTAAPPIECPCWEGKGTYCADGVVARAASEGCLAPDAGAHAGDLLFCEAGKWTWDTTCASSCGGAGAGDDVCDAPRYQLPWTCNVDKTCTAINAETWHHKVGTYSQYAYDFSFGVGGKVRAARGGKITVTKFGTKPGDACYNGCDDDPDICLPKCGDKANILTITHSDGTVAQYVHLNGPAPGIVDGMRVEQGQHVALSGNTGWSTGPHLHFMVMKKGCELASCQSIAMKWFEEGALDKWAKYESQNCP